MWSFGVLLFVLATGKYPFKGMNDKDLYTKIKKCKVDYP